MLLFAVLASLGFALMTGMASPRVPDANIDFVAAFDEIHKTVAERFFDPSFNGVDWNGVSEMFRTRADSARSPEEFGAIINEMLSVLKASHTHFYTSRQPEYFQLLGVFKAALKDEIEKAHPENPDLKFAGIGIFTEVIDGQTFISGVLDGSAAAEAGLRRGDQILSVAGQPFQPIGSFENCVGKEVEIKIQRTPGEPQLEILVRPSLFNPETMFLDAMRHSVRIIERDSHRVGYIHVWSFAGEQYFDLLRDELIHGKLHDAEALVLDLRDGWGGANPEYLNLFNKAVPVMSFKSRHESETAIDSQWRRPAALLINANSRSGKEVFAFGFQKHHIGPVVGERSAGAVLGGRPFLIRPGMLLYLAVSDIRVDGERLEGVGVTPDVVVPFDLRFADGADPQRDAAVQAMERTLAGAQ